jgi:hypothetical protein
MKRSTIILLAVFAVLIILLLIPKNCQSSDLTWKKIKTNNTPITGLVVTTGDETITLKKNENIWTIEPEGFIAENKKVTDMLNILIPKRTFDIVSEHSFYQKYDLDASNEIHVSALAGADRVREIKIGKAVSTYKHTYVRPDNDQRVFQTSGNFQSTFKKTKDELRDKKVLSFSSTDVQQITLQNSKGKSKKIEKKAEIPEVSTSTSSNDAAPPAPEPVWKDEADNTLKQNEVDDIVNTMSALTADSFISDTIESLEKTKPTAVVTITSAGKDYTLTILKKDKDNKYQAYCNMRKFGFLLTENNVKRIAPEFESLLKQ